MSGSSTLEGKKMMRNLLAFCMFALLATCPVQAHVGSADVFYEGDAGPYHLFVTIRLPQVIPGVADIQVRSGTPGVSSVKVSTLRLTGLGSNLPPVPDVARQSKQDPAFFASSLWFMEFGEMQVRIDVDGSRGKAELAVPVASFARQSLPMNRWLGRGLALALVLLMLSVVFIAGAVVREATVAPDQIPQMANRRRARVVMVVALILALMIVRRGQAAWSVEAALYQRNVNLLQPPLAETTLLDGDRLAIRPAQPIVVPVAGSRKTTEIRMEDVLPDHGHPMHLFLISQPGMDKLFHLHPVLENGEFVERLPAVPAGRYQLFADIVDKQGFPWTLVGDLKLPHGTQNALTGDDSDWSGTPLLSSFADTMVAPLPGGARIVWERQNETLKANMPANLKFRVEQQDGSPVHDLQPYMGMAGHAEVVCSDLSVFAHIHPSGSVPMASIDLARAGMSMPASTTVLAPEIAFPYGFPHPGNYRIFLQIKRSGRVQSAAFDAHVQ